MAQPILARTAVRILDLACAVLLFSFAIEPSCTGSEPSEQRWADGQQTDGFEAENGEPLLAQPRRPAIKKRRHAPMADRHNPPAETSEQMANKRVRIVRKGRSTYLSRKEALAALPLEKLNDEDRERVDDVLRSFSLYRELPTLEFKVEPDVYEFFARHPDVAVSIWRAMKISKFQMRQTGHQEYVADSGDGTVGIIDVLYHDQQKCLSIYNGVFNSPLIHKPIEATALFYLETKLSRRRDGTAVAKHRGRMFVSFPSQTVGTVAKVISPISNLIVDRNFREVSLFLHMVSLAMQRHPGWVEQITRQLDGVLEIRRAQLLKLTAQVYITARKRELTKPDDRREITLEEVMRPLYHSSTKTDGTTSTADLNRKPGKRAQLTRIATQPKPK